MLAINFAKNPIEIKLFFPFFFFLINHHTDKIMKKRSIKQILFAEFEVFN